MGSRRRSRRAFASSLFLIASFGAGAHAQSIVRVDVANDGSESPGQVWAVDVSDDGTKVALNTAVDGLDPVDSNGRNDVLVRDLVAGTTTLASVNGGGHVGNGDSGSPRISADGLYVVFWSSSNNLVRDDQNGKQDVFRRDLVNARTRRISVASDGSEADDSSYPLAISGDGNRVLFVSWATNLVSDDHNGVPDLFLRDVAVGTTIRVSTAADGSEGNDRSYSGDLSRTGDVVAFTSFASNLVADDTNGTVDVFVHDLVAGTLVRANVHTDGSEFVSGSLDRAVLSPDAGLVAFSSYEPDLASDDGNNTPDVMVRDLVVGTTTLQSVDSEGRVCASTLFGMSPDGISTDGRFLLMEGDAHALAARGESNPSWLDVYVRDRDLAMTTRQSSEPSGSAGNEVSFGARMSSDGSYVAFGSAATDLLPDRATSGVCAFLRTRPLRDPASDAYGSGLSGSLGVPSLTCVAPPRLNQPNELDLGNCSGQWSAALLLIGREQAQIPTPLGGDLLVVIDWTWFLAVPPAGASLVATMPPDEQLATASLFLQALELDAGAAHGVAFTAGLELRPGF